MPDTDKPGCTENKYEIQINQVLSFEYLIQISFEFICILADN